MKAFRLTEISFINAQKYLARSQNKLQSALTLGLQRLKTKGGKF